MALPAAVWTVSHSLLYGFHITALNGVQDALVCPEGSQGHNTWAGLRSCVDLTDAQFGVVSSILTLGGLIGTLAAGPITPRLGKANTLRVSELGFVAGAVLVGVANGVVPMIIGRLLIGISAGLALVNVPLLLSALAPPRYRTLFGTMHQVSIGAGMITAQALSLAFARAGRWRFEMVVGAGLALAMFGLSLLVGGHVVRHEKEECGGHDEEGEGEERPLLAGNKKKPKELSLRDLFTTSSSVIRYSILLTAACHFAQQASGVSPVMYFSTHLLAPIFGGQSKLIALGLMASGLPFNFVPGLLPSSFGTRRMICLSGLLCSVCTLLLAIGLNTHNSALSVTSVMAFLISFSLGLAPLPWLVLSEMVPQEARTSAGSIVVGVNWLTNFAAGSTFLPLQRALKRDDNEDGTEEGQGNIFFVFSALCLLGAVGIWCAWALCNRAQDQEHDHEDEIEQSD